MASFTGTKIKDTYKSILKVSDNGELEATEQEITDGAGNGTGVSLNTSGDVTATGTVAFGSLKDSGENITITKFVDEADGIANNDNDSSVPTSAAVRDYVDNNITAQDLDISDGTNSGSVDLDSQSLLFTGDAGVSATVSGQTLTLDSSALQAQITSNDSDITALQAADVTLQNNIDSEEAARISADTTLQSNITAEATTRAAADTTLQGNIDAEASTRLANDNTLQTNIDNEESARIAADTTLQTNIDSEASTRASADTALQTQITANDGDITALQAEDVTLQANIDSEASIRATADTALQNQISSNDTDIANLQSADTTLQSNIDAEATARASADTTLQGNIDAEETARIAADSALQTQITSNDTDISGLDTRLTTAEGNITSNDSDIAGLDTRLTTAEGNITSNDSDISALQSSKQDISEKGQANGYASLDSGAKVPIAQLPDSVVGQVEYQGTWDASTDTPTLPTASGVKGHYYVVSTAGTYLTIDYAVGDWVISNGTAWEKVDNTDAVTTVFGRLGNVVANEADYSAFYPLLSDLATTNTNVSTNASNIASNDSDISALDGRLTTAESDIAAIETKTDNITVTQAVDLDTIESDTAANTTKLAGIEDGADVTDATNVAAAGALMSGTAVLSDLVNVSSASPTDGQVLTYDTVNGWQPEDSQGGEEYTISEISVDTTAQVNYLYVLTASLTLTLPASPTIGDRIALSNMSGTITPVVARNGQLIAGLAEDLTIDVENLSVEFIYSGAGQGWIIFVDSILGTSGGGGSVDGNGTTNYISKWSDSNTLTDSVIYDDGTNVGIGTTTPKSFFTSSYPTSWDASSISSSKNLALIINSAGSPRLHFVNQAAPVNERNWVIQANVTGDLAFAPLNDGAGGTGVDFYFSKEGNLTFPNGQGIDFGATSGAGSTSTLLDDYEEGTWTMGISFNGGSTGVVYGQNTGTYTKIGRQVTLNGYLLINNKGSSTGTARLTGLPFAVGSNNANLSAVTLRTDSVSFADSLSGYAESSTTIIRLQQTTNAGITSNLNENNFQSNSSVLISLTYFTS